MDIENMTSIAVIRIKAPKPDYDGKINPDD